MTDVKIPTVEALDASDAEWAKSPDFFDAANVVKIRNAQCRLLLAKVAELEADLEKVSAIAQTRHPIGTVKYIGIREASQAIEEVVADLEAENGRLRTEASARRDELLRKGD